MKKKYLYIALCIMLVGLATMTTTLLINNGVRIASLEEDFNIYFSSAILDGIDKTNLLVSEDKQNITFETKILKEIGDSSTLEFEVTNNSTQYDAHVSVLCSSDVSEYISLTTSRDSFDIVAQTRETGSLTITLEHGAVKFIDGNITCSLIADATERESILSKTLEDPDYQITGTLLDEDGKPLEDKNLVVFSETPHYVTTDNYGFFYVGGLEKGVHEIYYMGDQEDLETKTKEEIINLAEDETLITTSDTTIEFDDISLDKFVVEPVKTGKVDITFNANGGSETEKKEVDLYTRAKDLPIPIRDGYTFVKWVYNDREVLPTTIINDDKKLEAVWNINTYTVTINGTNATLSKTSMSIVYGTTETFDVTPSTGYYVSGVSCTNGYTTNAKVGASQISKQTITIYSNDSPKDSTCTVTTAKSSYSVTMSGSNVTLSKTSMSITYGGTGTFDVTPSSGYYVSGVSCTNGYTTNAKTGTSATAKQTITVSNNSKVTTSSCTITTGRASYTYGTYTTNGSCGGKRENGYSWGTNYPSWDWGPGLWDGNVVKCTWWYDSSHAYSGSFKTVTTVNCEGGLKPSGKKTNVDTLVVTCVP